FIENKTLFKTPPPLLEADARTYPVSTHFSRRTAQDYVDEAYRKVCKIHRRLPPGGILVFLTGQNEIQHLLKKLRKTFPVEKSKNGGGGGNEDTERTPQVRILASEAAVEIEDVELSTTADMVV